MAGNAAPQTAFQSAGFTLPEAQAYLREKVPGYQELLKSDPKAAEAYLNETYYGPGLAPVPTVGSALTGNTPAGVQPGETTMHALARMGAAIPGEAVRGLLGVPAGIYGAFTNPLSPEEQSIEAGPHFPGEITALRFAYDPAAAVVRRARQGDPFAAVPAVADYYAATEGVPALARGASDVASQAAERIALGNKTPSEAVINALNVGKMSKTALDPKAVADVLPDIKAASPAIEGLSPYIDGPENFLQATKNAETALWDRYMRQIGRHADDTINGEKYIAGPMRRAIPADIKFEAEQGDPEAKAAIAAVNQKADLYSGPIKLRDLEALRKEATAEQDAFFKKGTRGKYVAQESQLGTAVQNARAAGLRDAIDEGLRRHEEEDLPGAETRKKVGTLIKLREAAEKQQPRLGAASRFGLRRALGAGFGAVDAASLLASGHPVAALSGAIPIAVVEAGRILSDPDFLIRNAMKQVEPAAYGPEPIPRAFPALPAGPLIMPPSELSPVAGSQPTGPYTPTYQTEAQPAFSYGGSVRGIPADVTQAYRAIAEGRLLPPASSIQVGPSSLPQAIDLRTALRPEAPPQLVESLRPKSIVLSNGMILSLSPQEASEFFAAGPEIPHPAP